MLKKAPIVPVSTELPKIADLARTLVEPADFYAGHRHAGRQLPDNILLFHRHRATDLNGSTEVKAFHQRHVLIIPLRGSGRVIANARAFSLSPGACVLIEPFQFHHYTALSQSDIDWLFVTFTCGNHPRTNIASGAFSVRASFWTDLTELIRDFQDRAGQKDSDRLSWRLALLLDSLSAPSGARGRPTTSVAREELLLRVSTVAASHLRDPLSVRQLAGKLGLSSSHLRQRFQHMAGVSLGRFLREFRLRYAAELLATGEANVTEASLACGWDTPYAFSRAFRKYWGRTPKSFALARRQKG